LKEGCDAIASIMSPVARKQRARGTRRQAHEPGKT